MIAEIGGPLCHLSISFLEVLLVLGIEVHDFSELGLFVLLSFIFQNLFLLELCKDLFTFLSFSGHSLSFQGIAFRVLLSKIICENPGTALSVCDLLLFFVVVDIVNITAVNAVFVEVFFVRKLHGLLPLLLHLYLLELFVLDGFVLSELVFNGFLFIF